MKTKITLAVLALIFARFALQAQNLYVNRVIVLNEGHYDYVNQVQTVPVTIGAYDPVTKIYSCFDTIAGARFASHVIVDGQSIYAAADNQLIRYDADTYQKLYSATVPGIRKIAVWNNQLLVSRGEYLQTFNSYFKVYDKINLSFIYELTTTSGPMYASEGIVVRNDTAFIAINNGYDFGNEVGFVGNIDLNNQTYLSEINLGLTGKNPENIILDGNKIYTVNNTDYTNTTISAVDATSQTSNTISLNMTSGCGASEFSAGYIVYQASGDDKLGRFNVSSLSIFDTLQINKNIYGMYADPVNNLIYAGVTDYSSYGKVFIYDQAGTATDSFNVSVSPGNMAFDIRSFAGINDAHKQILSIAAYPNPSKDFISVSVNGKIGSGKYFALIDVLGNEVGKIFTDKNKFNMPLNNLADGVYILRDVENADQFVKIIKK